ncbi:MAG: GTPase Era [Desulfurivibrio sp.]|jgi:GTP-binding protein Era|nr:MAG: GTPase Era [Desulfurivibrio sp.]
MDYHGEKQVKSGLVALIGPPNVGKSTLLNALLGLKISIVSPKPQTTRNKILGIVNGEDYQIVILDTPGIHTARSTLNREMVRIAVESLADVDVIIFMIDISFPLPEKISEATGHLQKAGKPVILLVNKTDLAPGEKLLPILAAYSNVFPFQAMIPISALHRDGTDILLAELLPLLPTGPRLYPADIPTDATERFIAAEIIREKIFLLTTQEVPYSCAVLVDSFKEDEKKITIHATIFVERKSQKGIIIGRQGSMLKQIGQAARLELQELLGIRVVLKLWVKIKEGWSTDALFLRELGLG